MRRIVRLPALLLTAMLVSPAALAIDSGDIVVVGLKGEVHFTVNGATRAVRAGGVLEPPATLRTGSDGTVELKQGATTVSVGPDTVLEFPALEKRGAPIDRILQPRGNAFYDIGKREGRKLRIETPYLVGVVKGTQFNVALQDEAATISLFEGLLEVRTTDDGAVVELKAGEIASRKHDDKSISVMKMDAGKPPATTPRQPARGGSNNGASLPPSRTPQASAGDTRHANNDVAIPTVPGFDTLDDSRAIADVGAAASAAQGVEAGANVIGVNTSIAVDAAPGIELAAAASVDAGPISVDTGSALTVGASGIDLTSSTGVDAGPVTADNSASLNLGGSGPDVTASTAVDAGRVSVDTTSALGVGGSGVDLASTTAVDAGPIVVDLGVDVGADTAVDLGAGTVDTGAGTTVDAGPLTTDVGTEAAVDLGAGTVDAGLTVGASAPGVAVDVGTSVAADASAGTVNVGLDVAGVDLGLGLDLGLDDTDVTPDTESPGTDTSTDTGDTNTVVDVGGLLDGLLRRPARR